MATWWDGDSISEDGRGQKPEDREERQPQINTDETQIR
jgi:hypothetical protein